MTHKIPRLLLACILLLISSTCMASYPTTTLYLIDNCEDTPDSTLCLQTLIPKVDHIDQDYKKLTRLAVSAAVDTAQSTVDAFTNLTKQPKFWSREVTALLDCLRSFQDAKVGLNDVLEETYHLGGGSKVDKESKRQKMMSNTKAVNDANESCMSRLKVARTRDVLVSRVQETTDVLVRQASNIYYILDHFEF